MWVQCISCNVTGIYTLMVRLLKKKYNRLWFYWDTLCLIPVVIQPHTEAHTEAHTRQQLPTPRHTNKLIMLTFIHILAYTHIYVHTSEHIRTHIHTHTRVHAHTSAHIRTHIRIYTYTHPHTYAHIGKHPYTYAHICAHICALYNLIN